MKYPKNHEELMELLDENPHVKEFMNSFYVQIRNYIFDRRAELGLTQIELANMVKEMSGRPINQATISRIERGDIGITADTYDRVLKALGMIKVTVEFEKIAKNKPKTKTIIGTRRKPLFVPSSLKKAGIKLKNTATG